MESGTLKGESESGLRIEEASATIIDGHLVGAKHGIDIGQSVVSIDLKGGKYQATESQGSSIFSESKSLDELLYRSGNVQEYEYYADEANTVQVEYDQKDKEIISPQIVYIGVAKHIHKQILYEQFEIKDTVGIAGKDSFYYLKDDMTRTTNSAIRITGNVTLCLNGNTLDMKAQCIAINANSSLTICDCGNEGMIRSTNNNIIKTLGNNTSFTLTGGTLDHGNGSIYGVISSSSSQLFTINILGGTIKTDKAGIYYKEGTGAGGAESGSQILISGGIIQAGTKGIDLNDDDISLAISGGDISGATNAIYINSNGSVALSGGVFTSSTNVPISCSNNCNNTISQLLYEDTGMGQKYDYYLNQKASRRYEYDAETKIITGVKKIYILPFDPSSEGIGGKEGDQVQINLITYDYSAARNNDPMKATITLGPDGAIPALAYVDDKDYQIAYFTVAVEEDETKYVPYSTEYQYNSSDNNNITAYTVDTMDIYSGQTDPISHLSRILFVNVDGYEPKCSIENSEADSNLEKYDDNYGLSPEAAATSMSDAGKIIHDIYGNDTGRSFSEMKNDTYAIILLGNKGNDSKYYLSDFEVSLSEENGETVENGNYVYKKHYQSPGIYISARWMGVTYKNYLLFQASKIEENLTETFYKNDGTKLQAKNDRAMLYNNIILDYVSVSGRGDLFVNGYSFTATENMYQPSMSSGGSPRNGGIPIGYPYLTINGGTVANDDEIDKNHAGSHRDPEGKQANITILSGKWGRVSGGSRSLASTCKEETKVVVGGEADVGTLVAAAVEGSYTGDSYLHVTGNAKATYVIGSTVSWPLPNNEQNIRRGNSRIVIDGNSTIQKIYGGTLGRYSTWTYQVGDTSIIVNGGNIGTIWGGSGAGQTLGDISVQVNGGIIGTLYGGGASESPLIEDTNAESGSGGVMNYGDKNANGYNVLNYNADKHNVINLGNTYGSVKISVTDGTIGELYGGGMGKDYENAEAYTGKLNHKFYNIAQICNCKNAMTIDSSGKVTYSDSCSNCHTGEEKISAKIKDCESCIGKNSEPAVTIKIAGGKIEGDIYAAGAGAPVSNRIAKICSGISLDMTGGNIGGNVYGGGKDAALIGDSSVSIAGGTFAHDIYGGGYSGIITGSTNLTIDGTADVAEDVYGGGRYGDVLGGSDVSITGAASMRNIFGGGRDANVGEYEYSNSNEGTYIGSGSIQINIDGSEGAMFNSLISAGQCGKAGNVTTNIKNFTNEQITGSIYSCGRGEEGKTPADINGDMFFIIENVTLSGKDTEGNPKYVYIGGTGNGRAINDIWIKADSNNVTYFNKYGVTNSDDLTGIKNDYVMQIIAGGINDDGTMATFPGAQMVEGNNSNGVFNLPDGKYQFTASENVDQSVTNLIISEVTKGNAGDPEQYFKLTLYLTGLKGNTTYEISNKGTIKGTFIDSSTEINFLKATSFVSDDTGTATVDIYLKSAETAVLRSLPKGTKYSIKHSGPTGYRTSGIVSEQTLSENAEVIITNKKEISVSVAWTMNSGLSTRKKIYKWNPATMKYDEVEKEEWSNKEDAYVSINVLNQSTQCIDYSIMYTSYSIDGEYISYADSNNKTGRIAEGDETQQTASYTGKVFYNKGFGPEINKGIMGNYSVTISVN